MGLFGKKLNSNIISKVTLPTYDYSRGNLVKGVIELENRDVQKKWEVKSIFVDLMVKENGIEKKYGDYMVSDKFILGSNEKKIIEFQIILPDDGPFTKRDTEINLNSRVIIKKALEVMEKVQIFVVK